MKRPVHDLMVCLHGQLSVALTCCERACIHLFKKHRVPRQLQVAFPVGVLRCSSVRGVPEFYSRLLVDLAVVFSDEVCMGDRGCLCWHSCYAGTGMSYAIE